MSKTSINIRNLTINVTKTGRDTANPKPVFEGELTGNEVMAFLSALVGDYFVTSGDLPKDTTPSTTTAGDAPPVAQQDSVDQPTLTGDVRITTDNILLLKVGDSVRWDGARYQFTGQVEIIDPYARDDGKTVFIRRDDTGKLVSLTPTDINLHRLIKLEPTE